MVWIFFMEVVSSFVLLGIKPTLVHGQCLRWDLYCYDKHQNSSDLERVYSIVHLSGPHLSLKK